MAKTIKEFRSEYPEYDDVSDFELTRTLHQKFYPDMELRDFSKKFLGPMGYMEHAGQIADSIIEGTINTAMAIPKGLMEMEYAALNTVSDGRLGGDPEQDWIIQGLGKAQQAVRDWYPNDPRAHWLETGIGEGLGQVGLMTAEAMIPGAQPLAATQASSMLNAIGNLSRAQKALPILTGMAMQADEAYQDAVIHDATPEQRDIATLWGAVWGATESAPVFNMLDRFAGPGTGSRLLNMLKQGGIQAFQEGIQELSQQGALNWYAQLSYDEQRKISEELKQSFGVGGGVGAVMGIIAGAFMPKGVTRRMINKQIVKDFGEEQGKAIIERAQKMESLPIFEVANAEEASQQGWIFAPFDTEETFVYANEKRARAQAVALGTSVVKVGDKFFLGNKTEGPTDVDKYVSGEKSPIEAPENMITPPDGSQPTTFGVEEFRQHLITERDRNKSNITDEEIDVGIQLVKVYASSLGMDTADFINVALTNKRDVEGETLEQYVGQGARLSPGVWDNRDVALAMEKEGKDNETIRWATGWFRGPYDKKWRHEISDQNTEIILPLERWPDNEPGQEDVKGYKLSKVYDNPALYDAYPELRDLFIVKKGSMLGPSIQGSYVHRNNLIRISPNAQDPRRTLIHEIQHWIQNKEGFDIGANRRNALDYATTDQYSAINRKAIHYLEDVLRDIQKSSIRDTVANEEVQYKDQLEALRQGDKETLKNVLQEFGEDYNVYRLISGEIEARDVDGRADYTQAERDFIKPFYGGAEPHRAIRVIPLRSNFEQSDTLEQADVPLWASRLYETIAKEMGNKPQDAATLIGRLKGKWSNYFKKEELDYTGLIDWLEMRKAEKTPVTKDELLVFLEANGLHLEEVTKQYEENPNLEEWTEANFLNNNSEALKELEELSGFQVVINDDVPGQIGFFQPEGDYPIEDFLSSHDLEGWGAAEYLPNGVLPTNEIMTRVLQLTRYLERIAKTEYGSATSTEWGTYTMPGGDPDSYKELLIRLPVTDRAKSKAWRLLESKGYYRNSRGIIIRPDGKEADRVGPMEGDQPLFDQYIKEFDLNKPYQGPHWAESNVLAHVRFDSRTLEDGRKLLFINEIQSDWHQAGVQYGYGTASDWSGTVPDNLPNMGDVTVLDSAKIQDKYYYLAKREDTGRFLVFTFESDNKTVYDVFETGTEAGARAVAGGWGGVGLSVPEAPFKGTEWMKLAVKRMLRYAAENGFDGLAWPGSAQQVADIESWGTIGGDERGWYIGDDIDSHSVTPIVNRYLVDIPKFLEAYAKGFAAKVEKTIIPGGEMRYEANSLIFNEEMKEAFLGPQTLFQAVRKPRGQVTFVPNGKAVIRLFEKADFATLVHELGHVFRRTLPQVEQDELGQVFGLNQVQGRWRWAKQDEEHFARAFERYIWRGKAPVSMLDQIFEKCKTFMRRVYKSVKGTAIDVKINPELEKVFNKMMTPGALNTQKGPGQMSFDLFQYIYGEEMAAMNGVTNEVVGVPTPDRISVALESLEGNRLHRTIDEVNQMVVVVNDPAYLEPIRSRSMGEVDRINRLLNWVLTNTQAAFYRGDLEAVKTLNGQMKTAANNYEKTAYDKTLLDEMYQVLRYQQSMVVAMDELTYFRNTPARKQLIDLQEKDGMQYVMHRDSGEIYRVDGVDAKQVLLYNLNSARNISIPKVRLTTDFITPDLINPYSGETLSKEEWLLEQHYNAVLKAVEEGQEVPIEAIRPHLNRDPSLQRLFDRQVEDQTDQMIGEETKGILQSPPFAEDAKRAAVEDPSITTVDMEGIMAIYGDSLDEKQREYVKNICEAVNDSAYALNRLSNVFLHHGQIRFLDVIAKKDLHAVANIRRTKRPLQATEYLASLLSEVDAIQFVLENKFDELLDNYDRRISLLMRAMEIRAGVLRAYQEFENNALDHLLGTHPEVTKVYDAWKALRYKLTGRMPQERSKAFWTFWDKFHTMQWKARRFPVMGPLFRAGSIDRMARATGIHNMLIDGGEVEPYEVDIPRPGAAVEKRTITNPGLKTFLDVKPDTPEYAMLYKLLWGGDFLEMRYTEDQIRNGLAKGVPSAENPTGVIDVSGLTEDQLARTIQAYNEVRDSFDHSYFFLRDVIYGYAGSKRGEALMKKIFPRGFIDGYMPHIWEGDYAFFVKDEAGKTIYLAAYDSPKARNKAMEQKRQQLAGKGNYIIDIIERHTGKEPYMYNAAELHNAIGAIISEAAIQDITGDPEVTRKIEQAIDNATIQIMRKHGIHALFAKREGTLGYDDRIHRVVVSRVNQIASAVSKIEFARTAVQEISRIHSSVPEVTRSAQDWFKLQLESGDRIDRAIGMIRAMMFLRYLGFNVKTALIVTMDKITNAPAIMKPYTKNADKKLASGIAKTVKMKFWIKDNIIPLMQEGKTFAQALEEVQPPAEFSKDLVMALHEQMVSGATSARFVQELSAVEELLGMKELARTEKLGQSMGFGPGLRDVSKAKIAKEIVQRSIAKGYLWSTRMMEIMETLNRESTFVTAYEVLRKEKGWDYDRAVKVAQNIMIDSHFMYGKSNLPLWSIRKGFSRIARPILTFRTFELNYVQMIADQLFGGRGRQARKGAMKSLLYLAALGGLPALPFLASALAAFKWATGDDPEQEIVNQLNEMDESEFISTLMSHGIPGLFGVTLRGSLQVGAYQDPAELIGGAAGSYFNDLKRIPEAFWYDGNVAEAMARVVLPTALTDNPQHAFEGFKGKPYLTRKGVPLRDAQADEVILSKLESSLKLLGFQPTKVSDAYRLEGAMRTEQEYFNRRRSNIYQQLKKGAKEDNEEAIQDAFAKVAEFNRLAAEHPGIAPIKRDSIRNAFREAGLRRSEIIRRMRLGGQLEE